jgi:hypothetical protein
MTATGDPDTKRMVSPGINGMGLPVEGAESPAGRDGQGVWVRSSLVGSISFMVISGHVLGTGDQGLYGWFLRMAVKAQVQVMGLMLGSLVLGGVHG